MEAKLKQLEEKAKQDIQASTSTDSLEKVRVKYLGKKGELTEVLRGMGSLSKEERPLVGKIANLVREQIEEALELAKGAVKDKELESKLKMESLDVTMPGKTREIGKRHPLIQAMDELKSIFIGMGFKVAEGPEVETVHYNFDALNAAPNHPSRDMSDTFYINDHIILRTQTSPVQVRTMELQKPPIRIISPGRCFRNDTPDATHTPMFHQLEGLVVDKGITLGDLKGTLEVFIKQFFGNDTKVKFRPHHFPFTEPSAEVDVTCFKCAGHGCSMCKGEGWIELLGAGMVHPNVLRNCGIDPEIYSGFAFGMGIDRLTMAKYEIDDIRLLFENDMRFINQF
ncbi:phenylalanyl-tRNA synthetase, alpha subunit [Alkaliphilus metalliredigens QYMF]|uniref:Phenylalanine--tRNA ligase alpha subunit n=1 Tax=Alkaliphilus metalliredigens (strain QYMF) TaxID=293826 RepID=SYFA_ALKMQ|nr:phenylalanine--tRNA ligase subunit alpha [Alkaliphilus metalliredigens]A6TNP8.1 RecName: Full=Phenylalanine--tRNA ligase alpha subunit; AltName: Full=Phenylalanyl-tRNA synthetase alpha subunit; Short=PheRS [Alkaliphilus metalliredigens QYMF]ABR47816.1 phenylalanyl-tRNA synthetase, alpha subunit [Alkaliphilus metalliredigens QYMF]